jgi:hypothetical protein
MRRFSRNRTRVGVRTAAMVAREKCRDDAIGGFMHCNIRRNADTRNNPPAARKRPGDAPSLPLDKQRAQGRPGAACTRSLVCIVDGRKHTSRTTGSTGHPAFPCAMVLRLIARSPRCAGLIATVAGGFIVRQLDPSVGRSGPHAFAVRISRVRQPRRYVHRIPDPTSVTTAIRPSEWGEDSADHTTDLRFR